MGTAPSLPPVLEALFEQHPVSAQDLEALRDHDLETLEPEELESWLRNGFSLSEALGWIGGDFTIDQAKGWSNHGSGPGDAAGCWTTDPDLAFAEPDGEQDEDLDDL